MDNNIVLATVGSRDITQNDMNSLLRSLDPQTTMQFDSEEGRKNLLQELINQELMYLDAVERGLDKEEEYTKELERAKAGILKQFAVARLLSGIVVEDEELVEFYNGNKQQFSGSESVQASHILVEELDRANEILNEINNGMPFEKAAAEYSSCPSSAQGGDLGYFTRGRMVPEFEQAAFGMQVGQVSEPVKTQFGYHLIKLTDRKEDGVKSFEEVKPQLRQQLAVNKQQAVYFSKIEELKGKFNIKINK